jgi:hypothetical protein
MEDNARRQQQAMKDLQDRLDFKVSGLMVRSETTKFVIKL